MTIPLGSQSLPSLAAHQYACAQGLEEKSICSNREDLAIIKASDAGMLASMQVMQPLIGSLVAKDRLTDDRVYVKLAHIGCVFQPGHESWDQSSSKQHSQSLA